MRADIQPPPRLCVDANLVLALLLPYERQPSIEALWSDWDRQRVEVVGPTLLYGEVISTLRLRTVDGRISADEGERAFASFMDLGIRRIDRDDLYPRAWELAKRYNQGRIYDMLYVALAQLEDFEFWTSDERLANSVGSDEPRLRWVPAAPAPGTAQSDA